MSGSPSVFLPVKDSRRFQRLLLPRLTCLQADVWDGDEGQFGFSSSDTSLAELGNVSRGHTGSPTSACVSQKDPLPSSLLAC